MDPVTAKLMSAAGAAADPVYVDDVFSTFLYEGTGADQTIANGIDLSGEGGMVWIKNRESSDDHYVFDTERGATKYIFTNSSQQEYDISTTLKSFTSTGFTLGLYDGVNRNNTGVCSWTFRKCPGFFDVVTYTGNGSHRDISHSLGSEPGSIWIKRTDSSESWVVYHRSLDSGGGSGATAHFAKLELESSGEQFGGTLLWSSSGGGEDHTASTFHVSSHSSVNANGGSFVAYIFAHNDQSFGDDGDEAIIKCGSYTGNGTSGSSVNNIDLGFEPQWVLIKKTSGSGNWLLFDTMRGFTTVGVLDEYLYANSSAAGADHQYGGPTATGFQVEGTDGDANGNGSSYIYMAIRRPHKPPEAGTDVFALDTSDNTRTNGMEFNAGFAVDWYFYASATGNGNRFFSHRLASGRELNINSSSNDSGATTSEMDSTDGCHNGSLADGGFIARMWKRAPGFCDVVDYLGNAIDRSVEHNLGVVPEMIIVKNRQAFKKWFVYHKEMTTTHAVYWNDNDAEFSTTVWYTDPVASVFYVSSGSDLNNSGDSHVALLFATLDGISKVGSYSGTGNDLNIDCGFTAGARFVMIKRIDGSGHWHQFDTEQGINSSDEPFLLLNGTTRTTGQDYIDPLNAGFTITSAAPDDINASGGTYIFLAIA